MGIVLLFKNSEVKRNLCCDRSLLCTKYLIFLKCLQWLKESMSRKETPATVWFAKRHAEYVRTRAEVGYPNLWELLPILSQGMTTLFALVRETPTSSIGQFKLFQNQFSDVVFLFEGFRRHFDVVKKKKISIAQAKLMWILPMPKQKHSQKMLLEHSSACLYF